MSKFKLIADESIPKIETSMTTGDLYVILQDLHDDHSIPNFNSKITFNIDTCINSVDVRGKCCFLMAYKPVTGNYTIPLIDTAGKLWENASVYHLQHIFHYEQDFEKDIFVIRPMLSINLGESTLITLGDPIIDKWKIIKGIYR